MLTQSGWRLRYCPLQPQQPPLRVYVLSLPRMVSQRCLSQTQFTSAEFAELMERNGIRLVKSAPCHSASNGLAERSVQTVKQGLIPQSDKDSLETRLSKFLLWYQLTPHSTTGFCPAELLMNRRPRSVLDLVKPDLKNKV